MHLDPNIALLATITCGIGYLMTVAGLSKRALELRRRQRVCPIDLTLTPPAATSEEPITRRRRV